MTTAEDWHDAVVAVGAHGLLNAIAAMVAAARTLERENLPPEIRQEMVGIIIERGDVVSDVLRYCLDSLPKAARDTIDLLDIIDLIDVVDVRNDDRAKERNTGES
jgi:hypothetical protein